MKQTTYLFLLFINIFSIPCLADRLGLQLLPEGRPFRLTFPDEREIKMSLRFEGQSRLHAVVGNYFSLFSFRPIDSTDWNIHLGLEGAGFFSMRHEGSRFPLETLDGMIGMYVEGAVGNWQFQTRYAHVSAHLADGSSETAIPFSRETLALRGAYIYDENLHIYVGTSLLAHTIPLLPRWGFQLGGAFFLPWHLEKVVPFAGWDLKWRQESSINPSWGLQMGLAVNNPPEAWRSFRFFYAYYSGTDPRGQFYLRPCSIHSIGIEMQI